MTLAAPFPWFGGKARAAGRVWAALGDVGHYVEPFAGSLAVLLGRTCSRATSGWCRAWRRPAALGGAVP